MIKLALVICLFLFSTLVASAQTKNHRWLDGAWEGTGYQIDENSTWTMSLRITGNKFLISYPSLNCSGVWRLETFNNDVAKFKERITSGLTECADKGNVTIQRLNHRQIAFRYSYNGTSEISASAILNRKK
jgi:hypothetical protein